jgi:hypothetical protein
MRVPVDDPAAAPGITTAAITAAARIVLAILVRVVIVPLLFSLGHFVLPFDPLEEGRLKAW